MAATNILATGTGAATAEFTVAAGEQWTVALKGPDGIVPNGVKLTVELKDDTAAWVWQADLTDVARSMSIASSGTYRVSRPLLGTGRAVGVFRG